MIALTMLLIIPIHRMGRTKQEKRSWVTSTIFAALFASMVGFIFATLTTANLCYDQVAVNEQGQVMVSDRGIRWSSDPVWVGTTRRRIITQADVHVQVHLNDGRTLMYNLTAKFQTAQDAINFESQSRFPVLNQYLTVLVGRFHGQFIKDGRSATAEWEEPIDKISENFRSFFVNDQQVNKGIELEIRMNLLPAKSAESQAKSRSPSGDLLNSKTPIASNRCFCF